MPGILFLLIFWYLLPFLSIPQEILDTVRNSISGTISPAISSFSNLRKSKIFKKFDGVAKISSCSADSTLFFAFAIFAGFLYLHYNDLQGTIPEELFDLTTLGEILW